MRALSPGLAAHLSQDATTLCHCWKVLRRDGVALGFTDHDRDVTLNAFVYAAHSGLEASEAEAALGFAVGGGAVSGALVADVLNEIDLANGAYDGASVETWLVNWADASQNLLLDVHVLGEVRRSDRAFTAETRSLAHQLDQERGRIYQSACSADLGDARCGVALASNAYTAAGAVAATDGRLSITATLPGYASGWFVNGRVTFASGANAGLHAQVKEHRSDGTGQSLTLWSPLVRPITVGDAFTAVAGCNKRFDTCLNKFANAVNFRGFPHMPGNDHVVAYASNADASYDGGSTNR